MRLSLLLALAPRDASACAVCFGGDAPVLRGLTIGIVLLVSVTFSILTALVIAVARIEKNRAVAEGRLP